MILHAIQIPAIFIRSLIVVAPLIIAFLGSIMEFGDYVFSGTFFRATGLDDSSHQDLFDFIVVGAGSSGSAVAARLSENPNIRVLLLEAGGDPNPVTYFPIAVPLQLNHPSTDWGYKTVRQNRSALARPNQEVIWPRGKSLGGSSNSNFMMYQRGNPRDFDRWAEYSGDPRWSYEKLESYFRRVEDYWGGWDGVSEYHGKNGPLRIESLSYRPGLKYVLNAARELGYEIHDLNENQQQGFTPVDFTMKRGFRFSTYRAYILPSLTRSSNLVVRRYSLVTKIHFSKELRAVGATYLRHGILQYASARREIVVCGGSINTPQLLMLSGLGPKQHLRDVGITPLADLPVGENLQDHVTTVVGPFLLNRSESLVLDRDITVGSLLDYLRTGTGPLSSVDGLTSMGIVSTSGVDSNWPNVFYSIIALGLAPSVPQMYDHFFGTGTLSLKYLRQFMGRDVHMVLVSLGLPQSRGFIKLRDKNPKSKPLIDPRYFSDKNNADMKAMIEGVDLIVRMYENTTALQKLAAQLPTKPFPGCEKYRLRSSEYYECLIRSITMTIFHPSGTCSMGKKEDPRAVVDSELRVRKTRGLRVCDASIMPFVTNANTNAPAIVIGEICSDLIKRAWNLR